MRLLIVGGTGRTGRLVVAQALERGHTAAVLVRDPGRAPPGAEVFRGDARQVDDIAPALAGCDAVITIVTPDTLGPSTVVSDVTLALIRGMQRTGVRRIVASSARPVVASRPRPVLLVLWWRFGEAYRDLARAEGMLQASDLDWRVVRAVMLRDGPGVGRYHLDREREATGGDWKLDRADFARAMLDVAERDELAQVAVGVGGPR